MVKKATGTLTVGNFVKVAATRYGDREAIFCSTTNRRFSFRQLNQRTNRLANGLLGLGLKKGDVAAFLCTNRAEIVEIYSALAKIGVLGIPLNYRLAPNEMIDLMAHGEASTLIFDPWFGEIATQVREALPRVQHFVGMGDTIPEFAVGYEDLLDRSSDLEPAVEVFEEDIMYMNLTSGTTGLPKSYLLTQYNNAAVAPFFASYFDITRNDVVLTAFPIFGRVGFAWCMVSILAGARNVIHQFNPQEIFGLIASEKVTISNWVPTMAAFMLALPEVDTADFSSLRALVFAAAPLTSSLQEEIKRRICPHLYEFYGLQETGIVVCIGPEEKAKHPASVGQVAFSAEVRIVDTEGRNVPAGTVGDIIAQAPSATAGYFKNEEKTREAFKDGWFHTGDLGYFDEEGFLYLAGRSKDMIVTGGQNVFSVEVEDTLMSHPAVADCAVIGLPDDTWGEKVTAVIVRTPGAQVTQEEIIAFCKEKMAGFKAPKAVIWREEPLPRTPTGKVTKYVLVESFA
ncbi:MAG: AMP-binding protein [Desulfobacterales bacterium]|nr:AMP-binding protein [Desulfobacterales bacterium]